MMKKNIFRMLLSIVTAFAISLKASEGQMSVAGASFRASVTKLSSRKKNNLLEQVSFDQNMSHRDKFNKLAQTGLYVQDRSARRTRSREQKKAQNNVQETAAACNKMLEFAERTQVKKNTPVKVNPHNVVKRKKKIKYSSFKSVPVSRLSPSAPVYDKLTFDNAVNQGKFSEVVDFFTTRRLSHKALIKNYYPAILLYEIYSGMITDGIYVKRHSISPMIKMEAFEDAACDIALRVSNKGFLQACKDHPRLKEKVTSIEL